MGNIFAEGAKVGTTSIGFTPDGSVICEFARSIQGLEKVLLIVTGEATALVACRRGNQHFTSPRALDFGDKVEAAALAKHNGKVIAIGWCSSGTCKFKELKWDPFYKLESKDINLSDLPDFVVAAATSEQTWKKRNLVFVGNSLEWMMMVSLYALLESKSTPFVDPVWLPLMEDMLVMSFLLDFLRRIFRPFPTRRLFSRPKRTSQCC